MFQLLVVAGIVALGVADVVDVEPAAAANPVYVHGHERGDHDRLHDHRRGHNDDGEHLTGARKIHASEDVLTKQHKIIESVYSPDYYEPTVILDYRYLKSGGRDYTRGPGGQIIILPHGIRSHESKDHRDYDSLIEFLRLRHLAQTQAKKQMKEDLENPYSNLRHDVHGHDRDDRKHGRKEQHWWN